VKEVVAKEKASAEVIAANASEIKVDCEAGLAEAIPALEAAVKALSTLKKSDIDECKNMKAPPAGVKLTMEAVCVMKEIAPVKVAAPDGKGKVDDFWDPAKKMMNDSKFLDSLVSYDKDNIKPEIMKKIRDKYMENEGFTPEMVKKASQAAAGLCMWVRAMETYDRVAKDVAPKRAKLAAAEAEYAEVSALLETKLVELKKVEDKLAALQATFDETTEKKEKLEAQSIDCANKLERAEKLISGLGGEKDRWTEASNKLGVTYTNITGDVLIGSGVVSYMGPFVSTFRDSQVADWILKCNDMKVPCSPKFELINVLGDQVKIRQWNIDGLPKDAFSTDNGIITDAARRWPLMIDPQMQANKWIKTMCKTGLVTFKLSDSDFARALENALQFGNPTLLENVLEELDPMLEPVLLKSLFKSGGVLSIKLGDNVVEYNKQFKFYITTKLRNPHYLPEVSVKVTLLNFMITPEGLEDQLLGIVVAKERPELEEEKSRLVIEGAENKRQLTEIEDKILHTLSASEGNILDDASAIEILSEAKVVGDQIGAKQVVAEATTKKLDAVRESYKPVAYRSSILFFSIAAMANIDPMYQFSLAWYQALFERAIDQANEGVKAKKLEERLGHIIEQNTYSVYRNVCRSLYEKDKLLFSFVMCTNILRGDDKLDPPQFTFFLTGGAGVIPDNAPKNPTADGSTSDGAPWLAQPRWEEILRLSQLAGFEQLPIEFGKDLKNWKAVYEADQPHTCTLPGKWDDDLNEDGVPFERCCILRCLRPDRVVPMVTAFVSTSMAQKYVEPPPFNLEECYADSTCSTPLIFILSPGQDPMAQLLKFGDARGFGGKKTNAISLGQGQGPIAKKLIADAQSNGSWVVLQNCHLAVSWMTTLEKICEDFSGGGNNPDFRLWLTSAPSTAFPVSILQNGVKMTNEPPLGLKANLLGSFISDPISDPEFFEGVQGPNAHAWKPMLFALCFFHAVIQERRKYGPIGWNIPYEFNTSDLRICVRQLRSFLESYETLPMEALKYCSGECNYGGRVTDDKDRRCLNAILRNFYNFDALHVGYSFQSSGDGREAYGLPEATTHEEYMTALRGLPQFASPEVFGLHANAAITKELKETRELFNAILLTQSRSGGGGGGGDALLATIAEDIASKLPADFDLDAAKALYPVQYLESMNTVLHQELIRFNRLTVIVRASLANLKKAIKGLVVMDADLEALANALMTGARPAMWMKRSYPSLKPLGGYVNDMMRRLTFFADWIKKGIPDDFWVSGFFFTQAFLTGAMQNYARKNQLPIDQIDFAFKMLTSKPGETPPPEDGVHVHGMFLEGSRYSNETCVLEECEPKVLFTEIPMMWFQPMQVDKIDHGAYYNTPLYKESARRGVLATTGHSSNFVMFLKLPSALPEEHWVKRGVAGLLSLDD